MPFESPGRIASRLRRMLAPFVLRASWAGSEISSVIVPLACIIFARTQRALSASIFPALVSSCGTISNSSSTPSNDPAQATVRATASSVGDGAACPSPYSPWPWPWPTLPLMAFAHFVRALVNSAQSLHSADCDFPFRPPLEEPRAWTNKCFQVATS